MFLKYLFQVALVICIWYGYKHEQELIDFEESIFGGCDND